MISKKLAQLHASENIAELLDEEELNKIGARASEDFLMDEASRDEWLKKNEEATKIAQQVLESKTTPWPDAANVKFPLITSSIISFASRTYPEIVRGDKVVLAGIIGPDPTGDKERLAKRLGDHMTYQLLIESPNWERDTDKLLMILPLMGTCYRKSYFDTFLNIPATDLCLPDRITINNHVKSLETARRITHQIDLYENDIIERIRQGVFLDIDIDKLRGGERTDNDGDDDPAFGFCEQHRYWDLDKDGYKEPYIVTFHRATRIILRIKSCFDLEDIVFNDKGEIVRIPRTQYFTDYHFIPNPDGTFHSMGYGSLLYPINETINTTINQILDAGTLSNRQSGFIGKQLRMRKGALQFKPGEWKTLDAAAGIDISRNIVPIPTRDPSPVLFQLLGLMISTGKELASVTDILEGQQPAQNAPATTVLALLEQGLKDQKAILKRLYLSLRKEFQKLARLNKLYLDDGNYYHLFDGNGFVSRDDYASEKLLVFPAADPNMSSDAQRMARAQALLPFANDPELSKREILVRYFDALQVPRIDKLMPQKDPNAPPPPEIQKLLAEIELITMEKNDLLMGRELEALRLKLSENAIQAQAAEGAARIAKMRDEVIAKFAEIEGKFGEMATTIAQLQFEKANQGEVPENQQVQFTPVDVEPFLQQFPDRQPPPPSPGMPPIPGQEGPPGMLPIPPEMAQPPEAGIPPEQMPEAGQPPVEEGAPSES